MKKLLFGSVAASMLALTGCATDGYYVSSGYSSGVYYSSPPRTSYYYSDPWPAYNYPYPYGYGYPYYGPTRPIVRPPVNRPPHNHPRPPGNRPPTNRPPINRARPATPLTRPVQQEK